MLSSILAKSQKQTGDGPPTQAKPKGPPATICLLPDDSEEAESICSSLTNRTEAASNAAKKLKLEQEVDICRALLHSKHDVLQKQKQLDSAEGRYQRAKAHARWSNQQYKKQTKLVSKLKADNVKLFRRVRELHQTQREDEKRIRQLQSGSGKLTVGDVSKCVYCLEEPSTRVVGCGHKICCEACAHRVMLNDPEECPLCKAQIDVHDGPFLTVKN